MKAFLVMGPESSGTRMVTESLIKAGAFGQSTHEQEMDNLVFSARPDVIVLRRSVPHGIAWPDIPQIVGGMSEAGYAVSAIVTYRDKDFCVQSQLRTAREITEPLGLTHMVSEPVSRSHYYLAYKHIFSGLATAGMLPVVCHYASFVSNATYRALFFQHLGLLCPELELFDANAKYGDLLPGH